MFWGFEVYFNLLVLLVVDCNKLTKMKKNDGILFSNQSPTEGFNTHTHKINYIKIMFSTFFLNVSSKYPSTIF